MNNGGLGLGSAGNHELGNFRDSTILKYQGCIWGLSSPPTPPPISKKYSPQGVILYSAPPPSPIES